MSRMAGSKDAEGKMPAGSRVVAVDLGASGGRLFACRFSEASLSLDEVYRFDHGAVPFFVPDRNGRIEERLFWDDTLLYSQVLAGLRAYRRQVADTMDSIAVDAWGTDGVFMSADGVPLERMYSYRDHRLDGMSEQVRSRVGGDQIFGITGVHFQPYNVSNQLLWFLQNRKELVRRGTRFLPTPTLFGFYLGGVTVVDSTWASVTQLMDCRRKTWSRPVLKALGIPARIMPGIVKPGTIVGSMHEELARSVGLPPARIIAVAAHGTASAFAAAPVRAHSSALIISSGTWSLVGRLVRKPITTPEAFAAGLSNEGGVGSIRLLQNCMGTWIAQELRRIWRDRDGRETSWDELTALAERARPLGTLIYPDDRTFYNPADMETALVQFCRRTGQLMPSDRGGVVRMVYESLALRYRMANEKICAVAGTATDVVHIVGGGSKNRMLNQMTADACGVPVVSGPEEATAVGNAMMQAVGLGVLGRLSDGLSLVRGGFPIREYLPQNGGPWQEAGARFAALAERSAAGA